MAVVITFAVICLTVAIGFAVVCLRRFFIPDMAVTVEWINQLSVERYRPMMSLLSDRDYWSLRAEPGYTRLLEMRLRAQRCRVFRAYLRCLESDFQRMFAAVKVLMAQSNVERPDLTAILMRGQATLAYTVLLLQWRLTLYRCGVGQVDASKLVELFEAMQMALNGLVQAPAASAA